jgi:hypothetical protein
MQGFRGGINNFMTNMTNVHTLSIGRMNLLTIGVFLLHGELVDLNGDVVGGTGITILVGVHAIRCNIGALLLFFFIFGVAVPALPGFVPWLAANLAGDEVAVLAAAHASSTMVVAAAALMTTMAAAAVATTSSASIASTASTRSSTFALC